MRFLVGLDGIRGAAAELSAFAKLFEPFSVVGICCFCFEHHLIIIITIIVVVVVVAVVVVIVLDGDRSPDLLSFAVAGVLRLVPALLCADLL